MLYVFKMSPQTILLFMTVKFGGNELNQQEEKIRMESWGFGDICWSRAANMELSEVKNLGLLPELITALDEL